MFKKEFRNFLNNSKEEESSFELIRDPQASNLMGGCGALKKCGTFNGSCPQLLNCTIYNFPQE